MTECNATAQGNQWCQQACLMTTLRVEAVRSFALARTNLTWSFPFPQRKLMKWTFFKKTMISVGVASTRQGLSRPNRASLANPNPHRSQGSCFFPGVNNNKRNPGMGKRAYLRGFVYVPMGKRVGDCKRLPPSLPPPAGSIERTHLPKACLAGLGRCPASRRARGGGGSHLPSLG